MSFDIPGLESFLNAPCKAGDERITLILAAVLTGKSISWYIKSERGVVEENSRKTRVSVPAPSEIICFFTCCSICDSAKRETRRSIAVVRTYVPIQTQPRLVNCHPTSLIRRTTHTPLLIIGNLLVSDPAGVNGCANRSSIYPNRTALSRDTLASLSVFCTTRSLEADDASGPTLPSRDRRRPGPPLRRRELRLGIWGADISEGCVFILGMWEVFVGNFVRGDLPRSGDIRGRADLLILLST